MNTTTTLLTSALLAAGVSTAIVTTLQSDSQPAQAAMTPDGHTELERALARLEQEQAHLAEVVAELRLQPAAAAPSRISMGDIDAAVERYMRDKAPPEVEGGAATEVADVARVGFDKQAVFDQLLSGEVSDGEAQALWSQLAERGLSDEMLAVFEQRVADDPTNPDKRVELGTAYLNKIQEVGNGPLAGVFATKADSAFDQALEIDDHHWEARFNKAVALSFWPPVFGKQGAAIEQFEILVAQQVQVQPEASHANTHLLLGNMYQQLGQTGKARAAWEQGASLFPDFDPIQQQLRLLGQE